MTYKISLIGAGNIGGNLAQLIAMRELGNVILYDLNSGLAMGKALDISCASALLGFTINVTGTDDISSIKNSDAIVVTAGIARKPGMQRDDLIKTNYSVMQEIGNNIKKLAPDAFVIVVTNPLDAMTWAMQKFTGFPKKKVVGMAGALDTARFKFFLAQKLGIAPESVVSMVLGGHGDSMIPISRFTSIAGIPIVEALNANLLSEDELESIVQRTRDGGAEVVKLLKSGSAFYAPSASVLTILQSYLRNEKQVIPCSVCANGHYGIKDDIYVGLPTIITNDGAKILDCKLEPLEEKMLNQSIDNVRELINSIK